MSIVRPQIRVCVSYFCVYVQPDKKFSHKYEDKRYLEGPCISQDCVSVLLALYTLLCATVWHSPRGWRGGNVAMKSRLWCQPREVTVPVVNIVPCKNRVIFVNTVPCAVVIKWEWSNMSWYSVRDIVLRMNAVIDGWNDIAWIKCYYGVTGTVSWLQGSDYVVCCISQVMFLVYGCDLQ